MPAGWGITMPEELGGAGLGVTEAAIMMHTVASGGGGQAAASSIHINLFGPHAIVVHGSPEQKKRWLTPLIKGEEKACFGVTEPDAGLDTTSIKTFAKKVDGGYRITGRKMWTSTGQEAHKIVILARTTPKSECKRPTDGMTLFYSDLDRTKIEVRRIKKLGRNAVDSNATFIDDYFVPESDRIGDEGRGFYYLLDSLNPERVLVGIEAIGIGRDALNRAAKYARDRVVFGASHRQEPGHPASAGGSLVQPRSRLLDVHARRVPVRQGPALRCGSQRREIPVGSRELRRHDQGRADAWRHGLRARVPGGAPVPRVDAAAHRARHRADDPELHRGEGAGSSEVVLT
jgi:alkylation response protein AidB-like acyl-CoA dehydrogenase